MSQSNLIELTYFDPKAGVRLTVYADTIITDKGRLGSAITAIRFGGYPEVVRAMSDAIYGGAVITAVQENGNYELESIPKAYRRQLSHDGIYAAATLMIDDDVLSENSLGEDDGDIPKGTNQTRPHSADSFSRPEEPEGPKPRKCYIFCPAGDRDRLFEEVDRKSIAPLIPAFRDYVLDELIARNILRRMAVFSLREKLDAWVLELLPDDRNVVDVLEQGLRDGKIFIPGADPVQDSDGFEEVETVTAYLTTFGVTVADRIRNQFTPLFDPASQPLSEEVLAINDHIQEQAGYSLYDAQLAVAEAVKRLLEYRGIAIIVAECGTGKTKIGSTALGALQGLAAARSGRASKTFNLVLCPAHVTRKWVREIGETLPDTYGMVVHSIADLDRLYAMYEAGDKSVYAIISKERARDGYMRYPVVKWNRRQRAFICPHCMKPIQMEFSADGTKYLVNADQFFFQKEHKRNHTCRECGSSLWAPVNPGRKIPWVKIGGYGWVYRHQAADHLERTKSVPVLEQLKEITDDPEGVFPTVGAVRRFPMSTYIKKKFRGRIDGFLCDELHNYNNNSGQGDAMAEIFGRAKRFVGMTVTLINGYSSGIFHLLYRLVPGLMRKDGKSFARPTDFDAEYGVLETTYETMDSEYSSNRRTTKRKTKVRQLPGVSPLVFSRFLLEYTAFLSLSDMGKDLPDYEEIPVPLDMPEEVQNAYKNVETVLQRVLKTDRHAAQKLLSAYMNLLTVYPDQPYDQPDIVHPVCGSAVVSPESVGDFSSILPKEEKMLEIIRAKISAGERILVYTSWTRTDSQKKALSLLSQEGIRAAILKPSISPEKREEWVERHINVGLQVLITNPACVETGLDLNAFTSILFYSMGFNLFTLRQASRRSWRINQTAPRVAVYMLYYKDTMQAKAMKLMASKLAVAGLIEGSFSEEGLAAMSDVQDLTSQMAKELALGIKDSVEDIAAAFRKMAVINPNRERTRPAIAAAVVAEPMENPEPADIRVEDTRQKRALYDGLLEKSTQETRRKKPKRTELEDQLSLFGAAA